MVQFKSIKLIGFKSFADKTDIPLTDGVTCIVGPNGCGKSNVADAIRWVLGEQSAKVMRGSQMMDVIFNGTEKRKKTSFCEVTLTFDNTNRIFDYDADELEMTRRLYRDGTSEYLLNQQPSRMKILTGLLHGAGAAKEGYSIIGQGRIAQIMNSRPEERRSIFEEATGIVVFKDRKAEAERKLGYSKDNLFVFAQRMQEVEHRLGPLSRAAENAKKYNDLYSNLRMHEINTYIYRHDSAASEREKLNNRIEEINKQIKENTALATSLHEEYERIRDELARADGDLRALNDERLNYTVGLERSTGESKLFKERARAVKDKLQQAQEDISFSTKRIGDIDREVRRSEDYANKNADRIGKLRTGCDTLQEEIKQLSESISGYEYMTSEHRKKVMDAFKGLSEIKENIGSLAAKKELLKERLAEMDEVMQQAKAEHGEIKFEYESNLATQEELNKFLSEENNLSERSAEAVSQATEKVQTLVRKIYDTQAQIFTLEQRVQTLSALRDKFEGYIYSVRRLMADAKNDERLSSRILGLIADVVSCERKEYEVAIETAFGGAMQNIITATREDARYLIEHLRQTRGGQITCLPVEALRPREDNPQLRFACKERGALGRAIDLITYDKKYDNIIRYLLGNTLICDNLASANAITSRYPRAFKIVTLEGDISAVSGSMTGGSRRENTANLLSNERQIKDAEEELAAKRNLLERTIAKKEQAEQEKLEAEKAAEALDCKLQNARLEQAAAREKLSNLMRSMANKESEYTVYKQSKAQIEQKLAELDDEYSSTSQGASNLSEQSDKASSEMDSMSEKYEKTLHERNEKMEKLNSLQIEIATLESAVKANRESCERLRGEKSSLISKVNDLTALVPSMQASLDELNEKAARAALSKEEQVKLDDLITRIHALEDNKKTLNGRVQEIDLSRLKAAEQSEQLTSRLHTQELNLQKIDADLEYLQRRIEEEYQEDYEGCLKYKVEDYDISASANSIANYKRQLTMLGPVNPNAIEEYEEENTRFQKMSEEKADMEKAIDDLTKALEDIRTEMLKIFNEGFNVINENFKRTFKELFGGGRAELQLDYTDCEDPLDAGVEIVACPPGKNLSKISLLSGGEQALTAIAILFAIIQMRPMPFCVLDEIEAALDDGNVGRYATYLKKFAEKTQFIVITHRKPTMEKADVLFGVTMEEKGVSKIVSVKLSEVESRLGGDTVA